MIFAASQVFFRPGALDRDLRQVRSTLNQLQIPVGALEHLINALTHLRPEQFSNSDGMPLLTRREEDVVRLVADGLKNRRAEQISVTRDATGGAVSEESVGNRSSWDFSIVP
jgi:hypothetical protein